MPAITVIKNGSASSFFLSSSFFCEEDITIPVIKEAPVGLPENDFSAACLVKVKFLSDKDLTLGAFSPFRFISFLRGRRLQWLQKILLYTWDRFRLHPQSCS